MYFGTYTPLLSLVLKTSEMSRHSKPDSLSFVKKWGLPLSTVPENYIGNHSSPIVQSLKNMSICSSSNLPPKIVVCVRKKTTHMCPRCQKLSNKRTSKVGHQRETVLQPGVRRQSNDTKYCTQTQVLPHGKLCTHSAWLRRLRTPPTHPSFIWWLTSFYPSTYPSSPCSNKPLILAI